LATLMRDGMAIITNRNAVKKARIRSSNKVFGFGYVNITLNL